MTPNVVAMQHYGNQQAQANPLPAQHGQQQLNTYPMQNVRQFSSMDALLGELLREVLEMRRDVEALHATLREARQRDPEALPANALKWSR